MYRYNRACLSYGTVIETGQDGFNVSRGLTVSKTRGERQIEPSQNAYGPNASLWIERIADDRAGVEGLLLNRCAPELLVLLLLPLSTLHRLRFSIIFDSCVCVCSTVNSIKD